MCSYIVEKTAVEGSAKGPNGWMRIDTANVFFDHPFHAPFSHVLGIDFVREAVAANTTTPARGRSATKSGAIIRLIRGCMRDPLRQMLNCSDWQTLTGPPPMVS